MFKQRGKRKEWVTADTWKAIDNMRTLMTKLTDAKSGRLRQRYQQQYSEADRQVKRLIRADTRAYIDGLAAEAEDAAKHNQQGIVYKIPKLICGKYQVYTNSITKDKQGFLPTTKGEQEERWTERFREILNRPPPEENADIPEAADDLDINLAAQEKEEMIKAIKSLIMVKLQDKTTSTHSSSRQTQSSQQPSCSHFLQLYGREGKCQLTGQRESSSG